MTNKQFPMTKEFPSPNSQREPPTPRCFIWSFELCHSLDILHWSLVIRISSLSPDPLAFHAARVDVASALNATPGTVDRSLPDRCDLANKTSVNGQVDIECVSGRNRESFCHK